MITGERSIGWGMRRIEALTGDAADAWFEERVALLDRATEAAGRAVGGSLPDRIEELKARGTRSKSAGSVDGVTRPAELVRSAEQLDGTRFVAYAAPFDSMEELKSFAKDLRGELGDGVIALALEADEPQLFVTVSDDLVTRGVSAGRSSRPVRRSWTAGAAAARRWRRPAARGATACRARSRRSARP